MRRLAVALVVGGLAVGCSASKPGAPDSSPVSVESTAATLPRGFPTDFPSLEQTRVVYSLTVEKGWTVYYDTKLSDLVVKQQMASKLVENGWTLTTCATQQTPTKPVSVITATKPGLFASVSIGVKTRGVPKPFRFAVTMAQFDAPPPPEKVSCQ